MNKEEKSDISKDKSDIPSDDISYIEEEEEVVETRELRNFEEVRQIKNSNPLLHVIYFEILYSIFYLFIESLLFLYKGYLLPYPPSSIGPEIAAFFFFMCIQFFRLKVINNGAKINDKFSIILSLALTIPVFVGYVYLFTYQTYSLIFDMALGIFAFIYSGLVVVFSVYNLIFK